jgi:predicted phosphodiesterase
MMTAIVKRKGDAAGKTSSWNGDRGDDQPPVAIGIMADSHGSVAAIERAASFLTDNGCRSIYHLGDIGDSTYPETVEDCIASLRRWGIKAIRGNNDHVIARYAGERDGIVLADDTIRYLLDLPLKRTSHSALFFHSLPFVEELGMAAMIRGLDESMVRRCLDQYPSHVLFRGHSHEPEIQFGEDGQLLIQSLLVGEPLSLRNQIPCLVTCGALTRGYCMLYWPEQARLICYRLKDVAA